MSDSTRILDLRDYWQMVRARMWTVVAMGTIVAAIAGAYVALRPPVYYAQTKVIVEPLVNSAITGTAGNSSAFEPDMPTEAEIVRSIDIARAVDGAIDVSAPPEQLVKGVRVEPVRDAAVMFIGYSAGSPETAALIANTFAEEYLDARRAQAVAQVEAAIAPFDERIGALEEEAGQVEAQLDSESDPNERGRLRARFATISEEIAANVASKAEIYSNAGNAQGGRIVQFAVAPSKPSGPGLAMASIFGFLVGCIMGSGIAILLGIRANRVGGRDELADYIGAPVMGVIPAVEGWSSRERAELVSRDHPGGPASEAYRTLATNVRFLRSQRPVGIVVVTSALPGEGKSATTANLAVVLAETGIKTLLIDADLRRPRAERFLGVQQGPGLREALQGTTPIEELVMGTDVPNLSIVRSGQVPHDPVALLAGPEASSVFDDMRGLADIIVCDAPPTLPVADASIIAEVADIVLFVHDPAISNRTALEDAVRQLRTAGADIAGGVYNNITSIQRSSLGYASYDQYYGPDEQARPARGRSGSASGSRTHPVPPPPFGAPVATNGGRSKAEAADDARDFSSRKPASG
ncbi:MAG TPA: polysaccharide biosynthesis tyrosine autokinase [Actinomycetota bacterium]|nr:polysaccharide biosynthesis tyrosine autokinase [Actinomycetota bacterium]